MALQWRLNGGDSVSNQQPQDCLFNGLFRRRSKKISKLRVAGLCAGNSPGTRELSAQMAINGENVSIWWRHHGWTIMSYPFMMLFISALISKPVWTISLSNVSICFRFLLNLGEIFPPLIQPPLPFRSALSSSVYVCRIAVVFRDIRAFKCSRNLMSENMNIGHMYVYVLRVETISHRTMNQW